MKTADILLLLATLIVSVVGVFWGIKMLKDEREKSIDDFIIRRNNNEINYTHGKEN
ncbi:MAG: hypothetical protein IJ789_08620 [Bacteroidales bacterium]|nr:hypothetical protein [Bacteroidales bacterium]